MISPSDFHFDERTVQQHVKPSSYGLRHGRRPTQRAAAAPSMPALAPS